MPLDKQKSVNLIAFNPSREKNNNKKKNKQCSRKSCKLMIIEIDERKKKNGQHEMSFLDLKASRNMESTT